MAGVSYAARPDSCLRSFLQSVAPWKRPQRSMLDVHNLTGVAALPPASETQKQRFTRVKREILEGKYRLDYAPATTLLAPP